jgi:hypothetical protein
MVTPSTTTTNVGNKSSDNHTDTASDEESESKVSKSSSNMQKGKTNKFAVRMARHMQKASGSGELSHQGSDAR